MKEAARERATLEAQAPGRWRAAGPLVFATVTAVLPAGAAAIAAGPAAIFDLSGVTAADSSGLALLIEWLSVAKTAGCALRYENMPFQLEQIARLSELEDLFGLAAAEHAPPVAAAKPLPGAAPATLKA